MTHGRPLSFQHRSQSIKCTFTHLQSFLYITTRPSLWGNCYSLAPQMVKLWSLTVTCSELINRRTMSFIHYTDWRIVIWYKYAHTYASLSFVPKKTISFVLDCTWHTYNKCFHWEIGLTGNSCCLVPMQRSFLSPLVLFKSFSLHDFSLYSRFGRTAVVRICSVSCALVRCYYIFHSISSASNPYSFGREKDPTK